MEHHVAWTEHHMATSGKVQGELRQRRDALHADLVRVEQGRDWAQNQCADHQRGENEALNSLACVEAERDAERANANEWLAKCHDAEKRIVDLEAKLADMRKRLEASNVAYNRTRALWWETKCRLDQAEINLEASRAKFCELEARLASAESPLALAERRYAQAWWKWYSGENVGHVGDSNYPLYRAAEDALEAAYAAAAKGSAPHFVASDPAFGGRSVVVFDGKDQCLTTEGAAAAKGEGGEGER